MTAPKANAEAAVKLAKDKSTKEPVPKLAREVRTLCHLRGLLIEIGGHCFNVARLLPPLVLADEPAKKGTAIVVDAIQEVESAL